MTSKKRVRSNILISWGAWTFIFLAIYFRQYVLSPNEDLPTVRIIFLWLIGNLLIIMLSQVIWITRKSTHKWILSLGINFLLVLIISNGLQVIQTKWHGPSSSGPIVMEQRRVNEEGTIKEIKAKISKGHAKIKYDVFWIYLITLGVVYTATVINELHDEQLKQVLLQEKLSKAQLNTLRAQLNPHFMFNALHTVSALMEDNTPEAQQVLEDFSYLLRDVVDNSNKEFIAVKQELDFLKRYVAIEKKRFAGKLQLNFSCSEEAEEGKIPALILQPLMENAIKHGILNHPNKSKVSGEIVVEIGQEKERLIISIRDDGPGLAAEPIHMRAGLKNTIERLESLYKKNYRLHFNNLQTGGLEVLIDIPFESFN